MNRFCLFPGTISYLFYKNMQGRAKRKALNIFPENFPSIDPRDARTERFDTFSLAISQKTLTFKKLGLRHDQNQIRARENFSSID